MRKRLLDVICCPDCKSDLELVEEKVDSENEEEVVLEGKLICKVCGREYPIRDGIPILLPPEVGQEV